MAAYNGHVAAVELLISSGADLDSTDGRGSTSALLAAMKGHVDVLAVLRDKGANLN
jgi:ankyrin repeat protein